MKIVKLLGVIFLAIFLILSGIVSILGLAIPAFATFVINLLALASGVLLLISLSECCGCHTKECNKDHMNHP